MSGYSGLEPDRDNLAPVVVAASVAQVVRALQFAAIAALMESFDLQRVMAAAHATAGRRGFSFGDSHFGTCFCKLEYWRKRAA
jgi:hypothetical protein